MLGKEENELLTRVGPGTPCGNLLRRYWQPLCPAAELTPDKPTRRVQLLGEDLVVFRLPDSPPAASRELPPSPRPQSSISRHGLLAERCAHRGVSLYYGFVEDDGVCCAYHGWKYAPDGRCLEQPFEPAGSSYKDRVCQRAYRVEKLCGLLWAYLGPEPAPLLPRWDVLVLPGERRIDVHPVLQANWLAPMENAMDTVHTYYLHAHMLKTLGLAGGEYYARPIESYDFEPCEWGIVKRRVYGGPNPEVESGHPVLFPNALRVPTRVGPAIHWRVPMNDTQTLIFEVNWQPSGGDEPLADPPDPPAYYLPSLLTPDGDFDLTSFPGQDKMAYETSSPICDRSQEHLGVSDRGIIRYRKLLREQIELVQRGGEPMALIRDPARNRVIRFATSRGPVPAEGALRQRGLLADQPART
jgi:5,5'-dehydrodivanillate O-demethylase